MKAAICYEAGEPLVIEEIKIQPPQDDEIRVKVRSCGICQSDQHYLSGAWSGLPFPVICGHEVSGTVIECGPNATKHKIDDRVIVSLVKNCGLCKYCKLGMSVICEGPLPVHTEERIHDTNGVRIFQGLKTGGFSEEIVVHSSQAVQIDNNISFEEASLIACGVLTGLGSVLNTAKVEPEKSVVVIGLGGVGMNCIQGASIANAHPIIGVDIESSKFELAKTCGANFTFNPDKLDIVEAVKEVTNGDGADYVFIAAGSNEAIEIGGNILAKLGTMSLVALQATGVNSKIKTGLIVNQNQKILGSKMGSITLSKDVPKILKYYDEGKLKLAELIASRDKLENINESLSIAGTLSGARNVINFE